MSRPTSPAPEFALPPTPLPSPPLPSSLGYRRAAVRDLAWLVLDGALDPAQAVGFQGPSPVEWPVTVVPDADERAELLAMLARWDDNPTDSWACAQDADRRLGVRAERLIGAWLRASVLIERVAMNWPLRVAGRTLGEADFLVRRRNGHQLWELAFKVYLGVPDIGWVGPGLADSLVGKLSRISDHQLPLVDQPAFVARWGPGWSASAWLTGWLLEPLPSASGATPRARVPVAPTHLPSRPSAFWLEAGATGAVPGASEMAAEAGVIDWWPLQRFEWLRPVAGDPAPEFRFASLRQAAAEVHRVPVMLAGIGPDRQERIRLMLVPQGWTAAARCTAGQGL